MKKPDNYNLKEQILSRKAGHINTQKKQIHIKMHIHTHVYSKAWTKIECQLYKSKQWLIQELDPTNAGLRTM